jgi:hypothetical protein
MKTPRRMKRSGVKTYEMKVAAEGLRI